MAKETTTETVAPTEAFSLVPADEVIDKGKKMPQLIEPFKPLVEKYNEDKGLNPDGTTYWFGMGSATDVTLRSAAKFYGLAVAIRKTKSGGLAWRFDGAYTPRQKPAATPEPTAEAPAA
jgi:hypothetical protein